MEDQNSVNGDKELAGATTESPLTALEEPPMPEIGEFLQGVGTLLAIEATVLTPPPPPTADYIFEEITARVEMRLGNEVVKSLGTWNDFYGKGKSITGAIEGAVEYAEKRGIGPTSEIEIVVVKVVSQVRTHPSPNKNYYNRDYLSFAPLSSGCKQGLPDDVRTDVWSSRNAPEAGRGDNNAALARSVLHGTNDLSD